MAVEPNKITGCTLLNPRATLVLKFFKIHLNEKRLQVITLDW